MGAAVLVALLLAAAAPSVALADYTVTAPVQRWAVYKTTTYISTSFSAGLSLADTATMNAAALAYSSTMYARAYRLNGNTYVGRSAFLPDLSSIPDGAVIVNVTFRNAAGQLPGTHQSIYLCSGSITTTPTEVARASYPSVVTSAPLVSGNNDLDITSFVAAHPGEWIACFDGRDYTDDEQSSAGVLMSDSYVLVSYTLSSTMPTTSGYDVAALVILGGLVSIVFLVFRRA